ncbi:MAG: RNA-binding S4 domain-containing protein [Caldilineaceae bacterium]|nr:RNA-binding S4 domain-containing protein [Caldilineaceae bacterium]
MEPAAETIKLDQFLKLAQVVQSGGEAKYLIQSGAVQVNGQIETRRGRKLRHGDVVVVEGEELVVQVTPDQDTPENSPAA